MIFEQLNTIDSPDDVGDFAAGVGIGIGLVGIGLAAAALFVS
jgi:hypothetical protein